MAVSKKKTSKCKRNMRRSHHALKGTQLSTCSSCGAPVQPHRVCRECGAYGNKQVLVAQEEAVEETTAE